MRIHAVDTLPLDGPGSHYVSNRPPLRPNPLVKLPIGAITPRGWLHEQLVRMRDGFVGHLPEVSEFCRPDSGWLHPKEKAAWEEVPYWLKGFGDLGYVLKDSRIIREARVWLDALLASQDADGWIGPQPMKASGDAWPNMIMLFALRSFFEATRDERVQPVMARYFRYRHSLADRDLYVHPWGVGTYALQWWQHVRAGDELDSVYWLYNHTGEGWLLEFARRIRENWADWGRKVQSWHGVNICQGFRNPALWYQQSHDEADLEATRRCLAEVYEKYGQVPGGMFGADEDARPGYPGPRQGAETCSMTEIMLSYEMLLKITGQVDWADRLEDVAFNSLPASMTPDLKGLHYLTAPNLVQIDRKNKAPGLENGGNTLAFDPWDFRCCQHNVAMGWPYLAEHLWMATQDRGLAAIVYAASDVTAKVADGAEVTLRANTDYPFSETITLRVATARPVEFPLYLRVPGWCDSPNVAVNGQHRAAAARGGQYLVLHHRWSDGDEIELHLPAKVTLKRWKANGNCVSVHRGPLTYSLRIEERWHTVREGIGKDYHAWPAYEVYPQTPWNYGLDIEDTADPTALFEVVHKPGPLAPQPFTPDDTLIELTTRGKQIPAWQQDSTGLVGEVQESPARVDAGPPETITLIPMGCARLRISAFPTVSSGPDAHEWTPPLKCLHEASHVCDDLAAVSNGDWPWTGRDPSQVARFTWRPHKGTTEWITYRFERPRPVSQVHVYWVDDGDDGECRPPASWRVFWRKNGAWKPVVSRGKAEADRRGWDSMRFDPVEATELKLEVTLQEGRSGGIFEWVVGVLNPS